MSNTAAEEMMAVRDLPTRYDPHSVEKKWYETWDKAGYFNADPKPGKPRYCITIPPPNVTGSLHMGHALQHAIHDALVRWKRMQGFNTLCLPGMDHAGIATQMVVEKQLAQQAVSRQQLGRDAFLEKVWEWKRQYGGEILRQLRALGCSYDWRREIFTLDESYARAVLTAFVKLHEKGLVYRGQRVINWCPRCLTALSDLEVRPREHEGHLWYIRYPLVDGSGHVTVATTRPETMLGDVAVAVHPEDERYAALVGKRVFLPLTGYARADGAVGREIPIIADDAVAPEFAYGALKITPVHDAVDFEIAQRHERELPMMAEILPGHATSISPVLAEGETDRYDWGRVIGKDGMMTAEAGPYARLDRFEAREKVVGELKKGGYLEKIEPYTHPLPHCDRCETVIEPLLSDQWFVNMKPLAVPAIEAIRSGRVKYVPDRFARLSIEWLENIRDWCISRQLWWGHRIPAWKCGRCGEWTVGLEPPEQCSKPSCQHEELEQDPDVLDTWFSSALWPFAVLGWPDKTPDLDYFYPTDILITDRMILYLWVARMIFSGLEFLPDHRDAGLPFWEVLVHPTILNREGKRMSRTLGTGVDPMELMEKYGADAVRFGLLAMCGTDQDVRFAEEKIEAARAFCTKIWNAARLVIMNLGDGAEYSQPPKVGPDSRLPDRWILSRLDRAISDVTRNLGDYRFDEACRRLHDFFWSDFCDWYVEMVKPRLRGDGAGAGGARHVLVWVLRQAMQLLHPFMPFITEELWQSLPHDGDSVMVSEWPQPAGICEAEAEADIAAMQMFVTALRRHKQSRGLAADAPAEVLVASSSARFLSLLKRTQADWQQLPGVRAKSVALQTEQPAGSEWGPAGGITLEDAAAIAWSESGDLTWRDLEMSAYIRAEVSQAELDAQRKRLEREMQRVAEELERTRAKLANPDFLSRAPAEVVEKNKRRVDELSARQEQLKVQLGQM